RRQQRLPVGNKSQQHADHQQGGTKHNRDHQKLYQGGQVPHSSGRTGHHGYSQNRRWHHNQKHLPNDKETYRNAKETENLKIENTAICAVHIPLEMHRGLEAMEKQSQQYIQESETKQKDSIHEHIGEGPKINLLQSSKDRLRRRLKEKVLFLREMLSFPFSKRNEVKGESEREKKDEGIATNRWDVVLKSSADRRIFCLWGERDLRVSLRKSSFYSPFPKRVASGQKVGRFMDYCMQRSLFQETGAGTGHYSHLLSLSLLQKDFTMREELQQRDVERWLGFITFLCEVFGTMRSSTGEPFRVLVCPIYTCLRELLQSQNVKEDAVLCCSMELQSTGRLLEEQLPEMMTELLAIARDKMLCPSESMLTRSLLLEV
ncbi:CTIF factor, partial [Copsychus sechellarum]|nr:CTIF factor [Copsychus sechellarum]